MKRGDALLLIAIAAVIAVVAVDKMYTSKLETKFVELEKQRIITSNKLATAKIVYENLNHVRDLVFKNMDFPGQGDTIPPESIFFDFLTTCVNDLKLKLVSVKPRRPEVSGQMTIYGYDIEIEGDFFKFGELCAKFENSRRIISLESFNVGLLSDKNSQRSETKDIGVKLRVNTYRVKKG
jgi:hypothetical protein